MASKKLTKKEVIERVEQLAIDLEHSFNQPAVIREMTELIDKNLK